MKKAVLAAAILTLGACDFIKGGMNGGAVTNQVNMAADGNQSAAASGDKPAAPGTPPRIADAGVTTSRSLQAFSNNGNGPGDGKDLSTGYDGSGNVTPAMLIGRWTDNGNCNMAVEFLSDGSFRSFNGGGGDWQLDDNMLLLTGQNGETSLRLEAQDARTILATNPNGSVGRSTRC